jgi:nicotinamidase-related amidase
VIDVQMEYFTGKLPVTYPHGHFERLLEVYDAARARGIPVVVVQHTNTRAGAPTFVREMPGWMLHPEIERRGWDHYVEKGLPGSFTGTSLYTWLHERGVDTVAISGYMTQMCCDTTARQALHLGLKVEFLSDATGTLDFTNAAGHVSAEELHRASLVTQQIAFADVMTTADWIARLD